MPTVSPRPSRVRARASTAADEDPSPFGVVYQTLLGDYIAQNRWMLLAFLVVGLFTLPIENVVLPQFYSRFLEAIRGPPSSLPALGTDAWTHLTGGASASGLLYAIGALWLLVILSYVCKNTLESKWFPAYLSFVRQRLFGGTVENHSERYKDLRVGEEIARIIEVSYNIAYIFWWVLAELVPLYAAILGMVGYLLYLNTSVGLVLGCGVLVHTVVLVTMGYGCVMMSSKREEYYLQMTEKLSDSFSNLMNVYLNNMKGSELAKNKRVEAKHAALYTKTYECTRNTVAVLSLVTILTFVCTIGVMYEQRRGGRIATHGFVAIWFILILYMANLLRLSDTIPAYLTKIGIIHCSRDYLHDIVTPPSKRRKRHTIAGGRIEFRNITFAYPDSRAPILKGFSLTVAAGEKVGILGTSGSGKTTAMKLLSGMYTPSRGTLRIDGHRIQTIDTQHLRKHVVYINQRTQLFNTSILKNIQYGNKVTPETIRRILRHYQLDAVYQKLPRGIQTNAGVQGAGLSLGMQKVTMLMRGILREGQIVVLDEPLAGLDAQTRQKVLRLIKDQCAGKTTLVITHDKEIVPYMDRVVNMATLNGAVGQPTQQQP